MTSHIWKCVTTCLVDHRPSLRERQRCAAGESFVEGLLQRFQVDQHEHVGQAHHLHHHRRPRRLQRHPRRGKKARPFLWEKRIILVFSIFIELWSFSQSHCCVLFRTFAHLHALFHLFTHFLSFWPTLPYFCSFCHTLPYFLRFWHTLPYSHSFRHTFPYFLSFWHTLP